MRFDDHDRRRLVLASALTIVALPAVWLANRPEDGPASTRPNVAAVGLAADSAETTPDVVAPADPMGEVGARYLDGSPRPPDPLPPPMAVGGGDDSVVATAHAIYRRSVATPGTCEFTGLGSGELITVVNVDNGRSIECRTAWPQPDAPTGELVMHPDRFAEIGDLTSAPIDVEIRQ